MGVPVSPWNAKPSINLSVLDSRAELAAVHAMTNVNMPVRFSLTLHFHWAVVQFGVTSAGARRTSQHPTMSGQGISSEQLSLFLCHCPPGTPAPQGG